MSTFDKFTNLYSLSKTLRFELKPYVPAHLPEDERQEYLDNFWNTYLASNLYENDFTRNESYPIVKELLDIFHRRFIKDALQSFTCKEGHTWDDLHSLYGTDKKSKEYESLQKAIRVDIEKHFKSHEWWAYISSYRTLIEDIIPNLIKNDDDFYEEATEKLGLGRETILSHLKHFNSFSVYFGKYKENRENMYKSEEQGTAIANRIVNENFPKFCDNIRTYIRLKNNCQEQLNEVETNLQDYLGGKALDEIFTPNYFNNCLTQEGISLYNWILGGNPNEDVIGINDVGNKFLQHNPQSNLRLKDLRMTMLFKQILSDREQISYIPEQFAAGNEGELQLIDAIESFTTIIKEQGIFEKVSRVFSQLCGDDVDLNKVYVVGNNITSLSKMLYGSWNALGEALRTHFVNGTTRKEKQELDKDISEWINNKCYSIADIISVEKELIGEHSTSITDFISTLSLCKWNEKNRMWERKSLIAECQEAYDKHFLPVVVLFRNGTRLTSDKTKESIKEYLDKYMDLLHACELFKLGKKGATLEKDSIYNEYDALFESADNSATLCDIIPLYNKVRSFLTRKVGDEGKMLLKFDSPTRANGWGDCSIFMRNNHYYLALFVQNLTKEDTTELMRGETCKFLAYNQQKVNFQNNPRLFICSKGDCEAPAVSKYNLPIEAIKKDYLEYRDLKTTKEKNEYIARKPEFIHKLINYYKIGLLRHESFKPYWNAYKNAWLDTEQYYSIKDFNEHTQSLTYSIQIQPASFEFLNNLQNQGKLFLFEIYNKDFAEGAHGTPNMHTLYWKELFAERNLSQVIYKLSSQGIEFFFRRKSISTPYVHKKSSILVNKTYADGTPVKAEDYKAFVKYFNREEIELTDEQVRLLPQVKTNRAKLDIIKDKRYTEHKFMFHVPITINFKSKDFKSPKEFNEYTLAQLRQNKDEINIIGIDRGERNLIYVSVINQRGENIIPLQHYNIINNAIYGDEPRGFNYLEKLKQVEGNRDQARKNWSKIENIKELKNGYLSQVVHEISKLVVQYNAIIVLEDLNFGFKRGRFNVERQVYQNFEKMLIQKLNFLVFKKNAPSVDYGNINNGLQLTAPFTSFKDLGKQSGWLFYVPAEYTSKIDAETGFVNLFNMKKAAANPKDFFNAFTSIEYRNGLFYFTFDYSRDDIPTVKSDYTNVWTLSSHGNRISLVKKQESQKFEPDDITLTDEFKKVFDGKIPLGEISKEAIVNHSDADRLCKNLFYKFKLLLQMRNSKPNDEHVDYLISPVASDTPFKTGKNNRMGIKDADANGAYHIALKGLYLLENDFPQEKGFLQRISTADWLKFVQMHTYRNN